MTELLPLIGFVAIASITPGPNNIMLATAGASAGFRATVPHLLGISSGLAVQIILVGAGVASLMQQHPTLVLVMRALSAGYLAWLALGLLKASTVQASARTGRPLSFLGAALFQWVNPKAWMMALTINGAFLPVSDDALGAVVRIALVAACMNLPCITCWAAAGAAIRAHLEDPARRRIFNGVMGLSLALTAVWIVSSQ